MQVKFDTYSHIILLAFLLMTILLYPFFSDWHFSNELFRFLFTCILISSAYTLSHRHRHLIIASILGVLAIATSWSEEFFDLPKTFLTTNFSVTIAFLAYVTTIHIKQLIASRKIDSNLLYASLCGYILIGLLWGYIYSLFALLYPHAFSLPPTEQTMNLVQQIDNIPHFIYYSFVTLTTLGYGDIVPISPVAQSFASFEAIAGQFYLTVLVARLVAIYVSEQR